MHYKVYIVQEYLEMCRIPYVQGEVCLGSNVQCAVQSLCLVPCAVFIEHYSAVVLLSLLWYSAVVQWYCHSCGTVLWYSGIVPPVVQCSGGIVTPVQCAGESQGFRPSSLRNKTHTLEI